jgi:eukaryotic-like serine/threonine-protein kinase
VSPAGRGRLARVRAWLLAAPGRSVRFVQGHRRDLALHLAVAGGAFLAAILLAAFVVFPDESGDPVPDVKVPGVVGLALTDAQRRLTSLGFKPTVGESRFSADAPKSTVLSQAPAAGTAAARGTPVTLDVSAGQQRATIPELAGLTRDDAARALADAGLELGQVVEQPGNEARGHILSSRPEAGQVVPLETRVDLVTSAGPAELSMPDVTGRDLLSARSLLEQLGLTVGPPAYDSTSTLPAGTIIAQNPALGTPVALGATISLRISGRP